MTVPLERALSKLGLATRSEARTLIVEGRVRVDGRRVRDPRLQVIPERIVVEFDDRVLEAPERLVIALHKPRGVVTTRRDPQGRTTIYDHLQDCPHHVVPVGRLDYATSGLLLLTNDTRFADWLTDPTHAIPRVYLVTVRGRLTAADAVSLERGLADRGEWLHATSVEIRKASNRETHLVLELTEGKNREIRRLLSAIGHEVTALRRVQFGGIALGELPPGRWRELESAELARAFPHAQFSQKKLRSRVKRR